MAGRRIWGCEGAAEESTSTQVPGWVQADSTAASVEKRCAYMHWVVRDPRAGGWLRSEFEMMALLDASGDMFRSHVHVTGKRLPVGLSLSDMTQDGLPDIAGDMSQGLCTATERRQAPSADFLVQLSQCRVCRGGGRSVEQVLKKQDLDAL